MLKHGSFKLFFLSSGCCHIFHYDFLAIVQLLFRRISLFSFHVWFSLYHNFSSARSCKLALSFFFFWLLLTISFDVMSQFSCWSLSSYTFIFFLWMLLVHLLSLLRFLSRFDTMLERTKGEGRKRTLLISCYSQMKGSSYKLDCNTFNTYIYISLW